MPRLGRGDQGHGEYIRRSLKLASWERGEDKKRELEDGKPPSLSPATAPPAAGVPVREATKKFYAECEAGI